MAPADHITESCAVPPPAHALAHSSSLPPSHPALHTLAQVVSVGPGARDREGKIVPLSIKSGDKVLLPEYGGHSVKLGEEEFQLFREEDILAKFE